MRVVFSGSRLYPEDQFDNIEKIIHDLWLRDRSAEFIVGDAIGLDLMVERCVKENLMKNNYEVLRFSDFELKKSEQTIFVNDMCNTILRVFRPMWNKHGKKAGILRNLEMLDLSPDLVVAFWDGQSKGTEHVIVTALSRDLDLILYDPKGNLVPLTD